MPANVTPRFSYKSDRLKPLRAFCQVVRLGSVSRAAEALFVSQPAISLQLQALEREYGTRLFERSGRRLTPTREGQLQPFAGETRIFIFPGYRITSVDALITNFHLPESTLLMLVSAFAGNARILQAYRHAVAQGYRFFSYGDAMLLFPQAQEASA